MSVRENGNFFGFLMLSMAIVSSFFFLCVFGIYM